MVYGYGVLGGDLVEVLRVERAAVLDLGVVVEVALDPCAGRGGGGAGAELVDDALNGDELDLVGVTDEDVVEQTLAATMVVRVDEAGDYGHLLRVVGLVFLPMRDFMSAVVPTAKKRPDLMAKASARGVAASTV